jgi:hypothetical protein
MATASFWVTSGLENATFDTDSVEFNDGKTQVRLSGPISNVVLLLHWDGTDGETSVIDYSDSEHSISFNGDAQLDTAQKKFGTASLLLDGTGDYNGFNDNISDVSFTSGDFTIEMWVYLNEAMGVAQRRLFGKGGGAAGWGNAANSYFGDILDTDEKLRFRYRTAGDGNTILSSDAAIDVTGGFHHIAYVNDTGNSRFRMFVDGTEVNSIGAPANITINDSTGGTQVFNIGVHATGPNASDWNGWFDEMRITSGIAQYTANFTPTAIAFGFSTTGELVNTTDSSGWDLTDIANPSLVNTCFISPTADSEDDVQVKFFTDSGYVNSVSVAWINGIVNSTLGYHCLNTTEASFLGANSTALSNTIYWPEYNLNSDGSEQTTAGLLFIKDATGTGGAGTCDQETIMGGGMI